MQDEPVRYHLEEQLDGKDGGKDVVEVEKDLEREEAVMVDWSDGRLPFVGCYLVEVRVEIERILGTEQRRRDHDAGEDEVAEVTVIAQPMAVNPKPMT